MNALIGRVVRVIGLRTRGYTNKRIAIDLSRFIRVDEHENAVRLHNLLCHIRLRPKPAKPSIKKNLPWQYVAGLQLPNLGRVREHLLSGHYFITSFFTLSISVFLNT